MLNKTRLLSSPIRLGSMEVCPCQAVVSEADAIQRKISRDPSAVNLKRLQAAWVLLEAVDTSVPRLLLRGRGQVGRGPCHQSRRTRQAGSELENAAGSGWAVAGIRKGKREEMPLISAGPWVSLLSRISDAKNSTKEKTRKPCNVTSETSQCKLLTLNAERPEGKVRRRGFQEASLRPTPADVYVVGIITGFANYRARP